MTITKSTSERLIKDKHIIKEGIKKRMGEINE